MTKTEPQYKGFWLEFHLKKGTVIAKGGFKSFPDAMLYLRQGGLKDNPQLEYIDAYVGKRYIRTIDKENLRQMSKLSELNAQIAAEPVKYERPFAKSEDKSTLRMFGVPFLIKDWKFREGKYGEEVMFTIDLITSSEAYKDAEKRVEISPKYFLTFQKYMVDDRVLEALGEAMSDNLPTMLVKGGKDGKGYAFDYAQQEG